jgi:hypothetical protein
LVPAGLLAFLWPSLFVSPAMVLAIDLLSDFCGSPKSKGIWAVAWLLGLLSSVNDFTNTNKREWVHQNLIQGTMMTLIHK